MRFLVNLSNHTARGQQSLQDIITIFGQQVRALGHDIIYDPKNRIWWHAREGINILVDGFYAGMIKELARVHAEGGRFLLLASEEPTSKGFNQGGADWRERHEFFPQAAQYCEGIFYLVPGQHVHDWYNQWAPAAYVELGYAEKLRRSNNPSERRYDFGFFGEVSPRRRRILKALKHAGLSIFIDDSFPDPQIRDQRFQQCKVILQIRKHAELGFVSSARCNTALNLGCAVIAEEHSLSGPWPAIVKFSGHDAENCPQGFTTDALMVKAAWSSVHKVQYENFKRLLTPEHCVGRAFREIGFDPDHYDPDKLLVKSVVKGKVLPSTGLLSTGPV